MLSNIKKWFKSIPKMMWVLIIIAFLLGFIFNGGGKGTSDQEADHNHIAESGTAEVWTCSMHPQIKLPEAGQCPICFMDLIPLETGGGDDVFTELKMSPAAVKLAEIVTVPVFRGKAEVNIRLSGKVTYDETRFGKITAWVPGRLEKLYVDFTGTQVKRGDPLVELYSPALFAAQEELLQAVKQVNGAKTDIARQSADIMLAAATEKVKQLGLTDSQIAAVRSNGKATDRVTISSPLSGVVVHKNALEGLYVKQGSQIYTIADLSQIWVALDAYESDLGLISVGDKVSFTVEALPGESFDGKIVFINPILNEKTRTVEVRLQVNNRKSLLKPGMFVRSVIKASTGQQSDGQLPLLIPVTAVLKTGKRAVAYVRKPDSEEPIFEYREVGLGARAGDFYIVISGLEEGELVVAKGNFKIDSAMQIAAKPSMMNPAGGVAATGHEHHGSGGMEPAVEVQVEDVQKIDVAHGFLENLRPVYTAYLNAQAQLAADDFKKAQSHLAELGAVVNSITADVLDKKSLKVWDSIRKNIHNQTQHATHWSDIKAARKAFEPISFAIFKLEKSFGHVGSETYYKVFCPMAFDNKGAPWLQNHNVVDNPYFGSEMPRCGEVRETFQRK